MWIILLLRLLWVAALEVARLLATAGHGALVLLVKVSEDLVELGLHLLDLNIVLFFFLLLVLVFFLFGRGVRCYPLLSVLLLLLMAVVTVVVVVILLPQFLLSLLL